MTKQNFDINKLRIASPCSVAWKTMAGDERRRFCDLCRLNVYNFSEMTKSEVEKLIAESEGRICGRLYKRADGTVLTKDCPVGLRAYQKRATRLAGAALTAILGLFSVSFGQKDEKVCKISQQAKIQRVALKNQESKIVGVVKDEAGAVIPNIEVVLINEATKQTFSAKTDSDGEFKFSNLADGKYTVQVKNDLWKNYEAKGLEVNRNEKIEFELALRPSQVTVLVGVIGEDPLIDVTSSGVTTTITRQMIERFPNEK